MSEPVGGNPRTDVRTAFLFYGVQLTPRFLQRIEEARRDLAGLADVHVIGYADGASRVIDSFAGRPDFHLYGPAEMARLGYPRKGRAPFRLLPGNTDMPILAFQAAHPRYDAIWLFEDDVVFTGPVSKLLEAFAASRADLLCTNICPITHRWPHMRMSSVPDGWPDSTGTHLRGLFPVFRASRRLLEAVDSFYRDGGDGHYEMTWLQVAQARSLAFEDIGGSGPFVAPGNRNRFYTSAIRTQTFFPGTFRYRPPMTRPGKRPLTLWHPVKETSEPVFEFVYRRARGYARWILGPKR